LSFIKIRDRLFSRQVCMTTPIIDFLYILCVYDVGARVVYSVTICAIMRVAIHNRYTISL